MVFDQHFRREYSNAEFDQPDVHYVRVSRFYADRDREQFCYECPDSLERFYSGRHDAAGRNIHDDQRDDFAQPGPLWDDRFDHCHR